MSRKLEVPFPHLIDEMRKLSEKYRQAALTLKAQRIHDLCVRRGHYSWANSIAEKYIRGKRVHSDLGLAMAYGLAAAKHFGLDENLMP